MNTNPQAIRILCYGDSNTWWYISNSTHERFDSNMRRTWQLQSLLGSNYEIIEEWLNSRTLTSDDPRPWKEWRSGRDYLVPCLESHDPVDRVILFLGTNELKDIFEKDISECIKEYEEYFIKQILDRPSQSKSKKDLKKKLLIIEPPRLDLTKPYAFERYSQSETKREDFCRNLKSLSNNYNFNITETWWLKTWEDWVHLTQDSHTQLAQLIYSHIINP
jgi:lysophospholipase L1-like esterase